MKKPLLFVVCLLILTACNNQEEGATLVAGATIKATETIALTPTLVPGLPTGTPLPSGGQTAEVVPTVTPTPSFTPTTTPEPAERLPRGRMYFYYENYEAAVPEFQLGLASGVLDGLQRQEALLKLGQSFFYLGQYEAAADTFNELLAQTSLDPEDEQAFSQAGQPQPVDAYYWLGQSYQNLDDCSAAVGAYESYLTFNPDVAAYVQPDVAACHLTLGDRTTAIEAYQAAADGAASNLVRLENHLLLADIYHGDEDYEAAIAQYEAILSYAVTEATRGQAHYRIGTTALSAGDEELAYKNFLTAVNEYPKAYESYLSLRQLIDAGIGVDPFQRGLVDYYADVYDPALTAFIAYIEANPIHREDVHLYMAWSYEALGNLTAALAQLDEYIRASEPVYDLDAGTGEQVQTGGDLSAVAEGILEKGKMQARAGLYSDAVLSYQQYLERFPTGKEAPTAAWWAASLTEAAGDIPTAITLYQQLAENYPDHEDADEALFYAGFLEQSQGNEMAAIALWQETAETYADHQYGGAALLWLIKSLPPESAEPYLELAQSQNGTSFYSLRANHVASEIPPFEPVADLDLTMNSGAEQAEMESWLREWLELPPEVNLAGLSPELAADPRLIRGEKLWRLGLRAEARAELELVRKAHDGDALLSYQMALFLRDLGLYRPSIAAAESVMWQARLNPLTAPTFLAKLAYPIYYGELITAEAEKYGYDPLLQFALIRQESLYESFALSSAVAQGLSQVIPDTGAYIAGQLAWPDYENSDLYRPYVGIAFGAFYLDQQLEAFDGFVPAALSAYNAGPGNAARWYGQESEDLDRYHELVNFAETKLYIERIYVGQAIYRHLYGL